MTVCGSDELSGMSNRYRTTIYFVEPSVLYAQESQSGRKPGGVVLVSTGPKTFTTSSLVIPIFTSLERFLIASSSMLISLQAAMVEPKESAIRSDTSLIFTTSENAKLTILTSLILKFLLSDISQVFWCLGEADGFYRCFPARCAGVIAKISGSLYPFGRVQDTVVEPHLSRFPCLVRHAGLGGGSITCFDGYGRFQV